jgi:hypothetical protein
MGIRRGSPLKRGSTRTCKVPHGLSPAEPGTRLGWVIELVATRVVDDVPVARFGA